METSGRLFKWGIELGEFNIQYRKIPAIENQVLTDFINKVATINEGKLQKGKVWKLRVDGSSMKLGEGARIIVENLRGEKITQYTLRFKLLPSNNETKYEALIARLQLARR